MSIIRFILYLLKHGSFSVRTENFEDYHENILRDIPSYKSRKSNNLYNKIRRKFVRHQLTGAWIGNFAYVKRLKRTRRQNFYIDSLRLCYVRIFKSASTSVLREIIPLIDPSVDKKILTDLQIDILANSYVTTHAATNEKEFKYFTLVRNPFHRLVSVYLDLFDAANLFFPYQSYLFGILKQDMSFSEFVQALSKIPEPLLAPHFCSQYTIIENLKERINFFRIEKDHNALMGFLNAFSISIDHSNKNRNPYDYRNFYTPEILQAAYTLYQQDVEKFDYRQEYRELLEWVNGK